MFWLRLTWTTSGLTRTSLEGKKKGRERERERGGGVRSDDQICTSRNRSEGEKREKLKWGKTDGESRMDKNKIIENNDWYTQPSGIETHIHQNARKNHSYFPSVWRDFWRSWTSSELSKMRRRKLLSNCSTPPLSSPVPPRALSRDNRSCVASRAEPAPMPLVAMALKAGPIMLDMGSLFAGSAKKESFRLICFFTFFFFVISSACQWSTKRIQCFYTVIFV